MTDTKHTITAFDGCRHLITAAKIEVALYLKNQTKLDQTIILFDDGTGKTLDLDLRGDNHDISERYAQQDRGRGRPKLGVIGREVTLLPRHWDWLNAQKGGASVALRKLVEAAIKTDDHQGHKRQRRDAAYHVMSTLAGNLPQFEEASRALFAHDQARLEMLMIEWPEDVKAYILRLLHA